MEHVDVLRLLGAPHRQEDLEFPIGERAMIKGVLQEDWITPLALPRKLEDSRPTFMSEFVTIYIRSGRVVQIEVRSPRFKTDEALSVSSNAAEFEKRYPMYVTVSRRYAHTSAGGIPAAKHFVIYEDAVGHGIAWSYGGFGNLAPDPDPREALEAIIEHAAGTPLLEDPDGRSRFIWKDWPGRREAK